jgi:hypothetical protein
MLDSSVRRGDSLRDGKTERTAPDYAVAIWADHAPATGQNL